jgi:hypothetical protein
MKDLRQRLERLNPPLSHTVEARGEYRVLTLADPQVPAKVQRQLTEQQWHNAKLLEVVLLHAINELRGKGSHAPLEAFGLE